MSLLLWNFIFAKFIIRHQQEQGENFSLSKINLAELERRTGISRSRLQRLKENNFIVKPHGRTGQKATATVLTGYSGIIDGLLQRGVTNSSICFERLQEAGYTGGLTTVKTYIADHQDLVPPKCQLVAPGGTGDADIRLSWGILSDGWGICPGRYGYQYIL